MAASRAIKSGDSEAQRIEDYLDDQIGDARDLNNIDSLIFRVAEQQTLLKTQLEDARIALAEAEEKVTAQAAGLQQQATEFQKQQAILERRMQEITYSSTSDEASGAFESLMAKLWRLEVATSYLELVKEVERLRTDATKLLKSAPREALSCYSRLRTLAHSLQQTQPEAEGAAPQLVTTVEEATVTVHDSIKAGLVSNFQATLAKMKWPQRELDLSGDVLSTWTEQAELLLELQEPDLLSAQTTSKPATAPMLLPLEVMAQSLAQRFRYHFYGDKPTNRLDKPEYYLSHLLDLLDQHSQFLMDGLQPILDRRIQAVEGLENVYTDAISAFASVLLPLVVSKSLSLLHQISSQPQLLSHFISESISFDNSLRDSWNYTPVPGDFTDWKGLTWSILDQHEYFGQWLKVEKDFALSRYRQIRDAHDSRDIDYEGVEPGQTKPMKGTIRVNDLLETITDRYRGLSSFSQKMKFLIGIQLSIFDDYHAHLHEGLQAYLATSHTAGRFLQGQLSKNEAFDQRALASLCKIYGSAEYLERKMTDWSDDVFFLELWEELQARAQSDSGANASVGKDLRIEDVAAKTSQSIKQIDADLGDEAETGALFDETASAYRRLKEQAGHEIIRLLEVNIKDAVTPFGKLEAWASLSEVPSDVASLSPSAALDGILQVTSVLLGFMSKALGRAAMRQMVRHFCSTLQNEIISTVVLAHNFSAAGVAQLKRDIMAVEQAVDSSSGLVDVAGASLSRLEQVVTLLGLPIKKSSNRPAIVSTEEPDDADDAWGFEEDSDMGAQSEAPLERHSTKDDVWGLWEAEKEVFKSNEAARQALTDMGLDYLSEQEARNVLKRRVELGS